jgi:hypothetical protein
MRNRRNRTPAGDPKHGGRTRPDLSDSERFILNTLGGRRTRHPARGRRQLRTSRRGARQLERAAG